jgi:hypothetical protein
LSTSADRQAPDIFKAALTRRMHGSRGAGQHGSDHVDCQPREVIESLHRAQSRRFDMAKVVGFRIASLAT